MFPTMVIKTMKLHVLLHLVEVMTMSTNFDLWMFKGDMDTFALIINYLNDSCTPMQATIGLFEVHETTFHGII
jgi:hypothetical protein